MLEGRTREAALLAVSLVLALVVAEVAVRGYAAFGGRTGRRLAKFDPLSVPIEPHGEHGYRQRPGATFRYLAETRTATANEMGFRGPPVAREKPAGTFRVILLGGSATHGWGVNDDATLDVYMRELAAARHPETTWEVVNLAFDAYDSYQLVERLRSDGLALSPDLILVNAGINDVRNARYPDLRDPDPRTLIWEDHLARMREEARRGGPSLWTRIRHHSYLARTPGFIRTNLSRRKKVSDRGVDEDVPSGPPAPNPEAIDYFERNLRRIAELARSVQAAVIFSTAPSALETGYEPDDTSGLSYWIGDAATTQEVRRQLAERMRAVAEELRSEGQPVEYLSHELSPDLFLDDCHLTEAGNRALAARFVAASERVARSAPSKAAGGERLETARAAAGS